MKLYYVFSGVMYNFFAHEILNNIMKAGEIDKSFELDASY